MPLSHRLLRFLNLLLVVAAAYAAATESGDPPASSESRIVVLKGERTLLLYAGDRLLERFPIGLGPRPAGDKSREGDGATPEGEYTVCVKNPQSRYHLSVGLDYPNADDADRALAEGRIGEAEHRRIVEALTRGRCPPWDTPLGGEIYVHGHGAGADWTLGCVALDDADMERLYDAVRIGTPVTIEP